MNFSFDDWLRVDELTESRVGRGRPRPTALQLASDHGFDRIEMAGGLGLKFAIHAKDIPRPNRGLLQLAIIGHGFAFHPNDLGKSRQNCRGDRRKTGQGSEKHCRNPSLFNKHF
jgi:hypothetical protein